MGNESKEVRMTAKEPVGPMPNFYKTRDPNETPPVGTPLPPPLEPPPAPSKWPPLLIAALQGIGIGLLIDYLDPNSWIHGQPKPPGFAGARRENLEHLKPIAISVG